jgi:hypothetical protein
MVTAELTGSGWVIVGLTSILAAVGLLVTAMPPSASSLEKWARRCGAALTDRNRAMVARYLRRTRTLQVAGATVGWLLSPVYIGVFGRPLPLGDNWVALAVGGYLVGAVAAEAAFLRPRRAPGAIRAATLSPRSPLDYVPSRTIWSIRLLPVVTVALAGTYAVIPKDPLRAVDPTVSYFVVASLLVIAFALAADWILRAIVARPQPALSEDVVAADDALRACSMHALAAAVVALILLSSGWALVSVGMVTSVAWLGQVLIWLGLITDILAVGAWIGLSHPRTWRVRHDRPMVSAR